MLAMLRYDLKKICTQLMYATYAYTHLSYDLRDKGLVRLECTCRHLQSLDDSICLAFRSNHS